LPSFCLFWISDVKREHSCRTSEKPEKKRSEKSRECPKRDLTGHSLTRFGPAIAVKCTLGALLEPLFRPFQGEVRRSLIPRTSVNRGKKKGWRLAVPAPPSSDHASATIREPWQTSIGIRCLSLRTRSVTLHHAAFDQAAWLDSDERLKPLQRYPAHASSATPRSSRARA
jgi:hypothetical protein